MMFPKEAKKKKQKSHKASIMQEKDGICYLCALLQQDYRTHSYLEEHHIYGGPNRDKSEAEGLKVYLCLRHHRTGPEAVHNNAGIMRLLRQQGQIAYEQTHSREEFRKLMGKSYL